MLSTFRHLLRKFSNIQGRIYLNGKHIYGSSEERIQAFIIIPWRPRLSFRLGWIVFKPCLFPLRYESKSCSSYCCSFEGKPESARSMYRLHAPCIGVQNERSKRMSNSPHLAQQSKILQIQALRTDLEQRDRYRLEECEMKTLIQKN